MAAKADPGRGSLEEFNATCDHWREIRDRSAILLRQVELLCLSRESQRLIKELNQLARSYLDRKQHSVYCDDKNMESQQRDTLGVLQGISRLLRPLRRYKQPLCVYRSELKAALLQLNRFATWQHQVFSQQVKIESSLASLAPDAARGQKITESGKKGHAQVYGTEEVKVAKWLGWQLACDGYRASHPEATKADIERWVARDFDVSTRTVRTRCQISPKQPQKN